MTSISYTDPFSTLATAGGPFVAIKARYKKNSAPPQIQWYMALISSTLLISYQPDRLIRLTAEG